MKGRASAKLAEQKTDVILAALYPGARVAKAGKRLNWFFRDGQRVPITAADDLFGCFDRVVVHDLGVLFIQATIFRPDRQLVRERMKKIRERFADHLHPFDPSWMIVEIWAWEPAKAMHVWKWRWTDSEWVREPSVVKIRKDVVTWEMRDAA